MEETVYIKFDTRCKASGGRVSLGDVGSVLCENKSIQAKARAIRLMDMPEKKGYREIFSVMAVIEKIQQQCPNTSVNNLGSPDFIVEYSGGESSQKAVNILKGIMIGIVMLFGSGFAIMTFNNDVGIPQLFDKLYELVLGSADARNNVLEISYSIGLTLGIIVFYNHFAGVRFDQDPTPIEVQMRSYEGDIDTAVIDNAGRDGQEKDAD
jgi:stage V sporulation protein AA